MSISGLGTHDKILKELKEKKLCPSHLGLEDSQDCDYDTVIDCDSCRELSITRGKEKNNI